MSPALQSAWTTSVDISVETASECALVEDEGHFRHGSLVLRWQPCQFIWLRCHPMILLSLPLFLWAAPHIRIKSVPASYPLFSPPPPPPRMRGCGLGPFSALRTGRAQPSGPSDPAVSWPVDPSRSMSPHFPPCAILWPFPP